MVFVVGVDAVVTDFDGAYGFALEGSGEWCFENFKLQMSTSMSNIHLCASSISTGFQGSLACARKDT